MQISISLDTLARVDVTPITFRRGDVFPFSVSFVKNGARVELPSGATGKLGIKSSLGSTVFLALATTWKKNGVGDSAIYTFDLNLNTAELQSSFASVKKIDALMEVQWKTDGNVFSSTSFQVSITENIFLGTEGLPAATPELKASESSAVAGTDNSLWMTPLRTFQAIASWVSSNLSLSWNDITGKPTAFPPSAHSHQMGDVAGLQQALDAKQPAGSYATLNGGTIPASQLPSYVDDVLEYGASSAFPSIGEQSKIYTALDTRKIYRWSGSTYVEISPSPGSTDVILEGSNNLYFTEARAIAALGNTLASYATTTALQAALNTKAGSAKIDVFTSSGSWTKPTGAKVIQVFSIGGGGGGGRGASIRWDTSYGDPYATGGGGGGGGGYFVGTFPASCFGPGANIIIVGDGGLGAGVLGNIPDGTNGGDSFIYSFDFNFNNDRTDLSEGGRPGDFGSGRILARATGGAVGGQGVFGATTYFYDPGSGYINAPYPSPPIPEAAAGGFPFGNNGGVPTKNNGGNGGDKFLAGLGGGAGGGSSTQNFSGGRGGNNISTWILGGAGGSPNSNGGIPQEDTSIAFPIGVGAAGGGGGAGSIDVYYTGGNGAAASGFGNGGGGGGAASGFGNGGGGGNGSPGCVVIITYF